MSDCQRTAVSRPVQSGTVCQGEGISRRTGSHIMDALSEVGLSDPAIMRALKRLERPYS